MAKAQEIKPNLTKSILYTLDIDKYSNKTVRTILDQIEKSHSDFELYSINRYRDKRNKQFIEILFEKK